MMLFKQIFQLTFGSFWKLKFGDLHNAPIFECMVIFIWSSLSLLMVAFIYIATSQFVTRVSAIVTHIQRAEKYIFVLEYTMNKLTLFLALYMQKYGHH